MQSYSVYVNYLCKGHELKTESESCKLVNCLKYSPFAFVIYHFLHTADTIFEIDVCRR